MKTGTSFKKNMSLALAAQTISLIISVVMSFLVSKKMSVASYGYWQLFVFFMAYMPISALGLLDGVYLRELGKEYEKLDKPLLGSQFKVLTVQQILIAIAIIITVQMEADNNRTYALTMVAIYMILFNLSYFIGYIFQATNNVWIFSLSIIIDKGFFVILLVGLLLFRIKDFHIYIIAYTISKLISLLYCIYKGREIIFVKQKIIKGTVNELIENIKVGAKITVGNLAGMFIIGCGRLVVDWKWGIEVFSVFSFSITLVNFFLTFIGQISMVILPALKQVDKQHQKQNFDLLRKILPILLLGIMVFYVPGKAVLMMWLPQYEKSFVYMAILLPICIFDGKMQLVNNVYLKMQRKENMILGINLVCVTLAMILSFISAIIFNDPQWVMISVVIVVGIRSVYSEKYLEKLLGVKQSKLIWWEIILVILFVLINLFCSMWIAFIGYTIIFSIYIISNRKVVFQIMRKQ